MFLPWPRSTLVQGVVWPPDQAQLRADEGGLVDTVLMADGHNAQADDVVLQLVNPALQAAWVRQSSRVAALEATLIDALPAGGAQFFFAAVWASAGAAAPTNRAASAAAAGMASKRIGVIGSSLEVRFSADAYLRGSTSSHTSWPMLLVSPGEAAR